MNLKSLSRVNRPAMAFANYPLPDRFMVGNVLAVSLSLVLVLPVLADTTWVSDGPVTGIWSVDGSPYWIVGNAWVPEGDSLIIRAGVEVILDALRVLAVSGFLGGYGTEAQPITVRSDTSNWPVLSSGIRVYSRAPRGMRLEHVLLSDMNTLASVDSSHAEFDHCRFFCDRAVGLRIQNSGFAEIVECSFEGGASDHAAGMLIHHNSSAVITRTSFLHLAATDAPAIMADSSRLEILDCEFLENAGMLWGGAIFAQDCHLAVQHSVFYCNGAMLGGAIFASGQASPSRIEIDHCLFVENNWLQSNRQTGGAIIAACRESRIVQSTFIRNVAPNGSAIRTTRPAEVTNCVFFDQRGSAAVYADSLISLQYCDFAPSGWQDTDGRGIHPEFGLLTTVNANGDSCDNFQNIFLSPEFIDPWGDYHLRENSPCIDAGDPSFELDPDSTISDIGVYWFDQTASSASRTSPLAKELRLFDPYPNPFNSQTTLVWSQPAKGSVRLAIFDLLGRRVADLIHGNHEQGIHRVAWNGDDQPAGLYLVALESNGDRLVRKLVLLK